MPEQEGPPGNHTARIARMIVLSMGTQFPGITRIGMMTMMLFSCQKALPALVSMKMHIIIRSAHSRG